MKGDRGVSEVLGYVLIIGLVTVLITVVMTMGISGLESSQETEQLNNMERAFDVLDYNIEKLANREAPSRATEFRLVDGSLTYAEPTIINVTVDGAMIDNRTLVTYPIVYDSGTGSEIVYEGGAIIRTDDQQSRMISEPRFVFGDDDLTISTVRTRAMGGSETTIEESGTVLLRGEYLSTEVSSKSIENRNVTITIESARTDAWAKYFESVDTKSLEQNGELIELELETNATEIHLHETRTRFTMTR